MRPAPWLSDRHPPEPSLRIFPAMPTFFYKQASAPKRHRYLRQQIIFSSLFSLLVFQRINSFVIYQTIDTIGKFHCNFSTWKPGFQVGYSINNCSNSLDSSFLAKISFNDEIAKFLYSFLFLY